MSDGQKSKIGKKTIYEVSDKHTNWQNKTKNKYKKLVLCSCVYCAYNFIESSTKQCIHYTS